MGKLGGLIKTQLVKNKKKRKPDPRVWIFSSTDNSHYNYNSRYLFEYVRAELPEITPYFVINDDLATCVKEVHSLIQNEKSRASRNINYINHIREELKGFSKGE